MTSSVSERSSCAYVDHLPRMGLGRWTCFLFIDIRHRCCYSDLGSSIHNMDTNLDELRPQIPALHKEKHIMNYNMRICSILIIVLLITIVTAHRAYMSNIERYKYMCHVLSHFSHVYFIIHYHSFMMSHL